MPDFLRIPKGVYGDGIESFRCASSVTSVFNASLQKEGSGRGGGIGRGGGGVGEGEHSRPAILTPLPPSPSEKTIYTF